MKVVRLASYQPSGSQLQRVRVEALCAAGLPQLTMTGLPDAWLRESRDKLQALLSVRGVWKGARRLLVHLLPVDLPKQGAHWELPIFLACRLALREGEADEGMRARLESFAFAGALDLEGRVLPSPTVDAWSLECHELLGPADFSDADQAWEFLLTGRRPPRLRVTGEPSENVAAPAAGPVMTAPIGRRWEKFWIGVAWVARLPVLLEGPPGTGKTSLAYWARRLLPAPDEQARARIARTWREAGLCPEDGAPWVAPHARSHLAEFLGPSCAGRALPGHFALAHGGALLLDEFAELPRDCREILRNVLDQRELRRHLRAGHVHWPTDFWLLATCNPCPCGAYRPGQNWSEGGQCACTRSARASYRARLSGPLLDRFGVRLWVDAQDREELGAQVPFPKNESVWPRRLHEARARLAAPRSGTRQRRTAQAARLEAAFLACAPGNRLFAQLYERLGDIT